MLRTRTVSFAKLFLGLYLYGFGLAVMVNAKIGISPWDVLAQGVSVQARVSYGIAQIIISAVVLLVWIPIRQKPGVGTFLNAVFVGVFADLTFPILPTFTQYWLQLASFIVGMVVLAFATGLYITARLGSGPRDGLTVGLSKTLKRPVWQIRTSLEIVVLFIGWLMGGQVREGTLIFAVCIGYLMQLSLRFFKFEKLTVAEMD